MTLVKNRIELDALTAAETALLSQQFSERIKLIFFDIDGTLLNSNIIVPAAVIAQIQRLQRGGIKMAIASGRPYFAAHYFTNDLSLDGPGLFCTGAMLYVPERQQLLEKHPLDKQEVIRLAHLARVLDLHCELYTEHDYYIEQQTDYSEYHAQYLGQAAKVKSFDNLLQSETEILKALVAYEGSSGHEKYLQIQAALPKLHYAHGHGADRPNIYFTSIVSAQTNKKMAFKRLCLAHGVTASQVLSVGDGDSDIDFITAAGVGIAMGNAKDDVKQHSDYVGKSVDAGGLEQILRLIKP